MEHDAESDRARLAGTIEALRGRLSSGGGLSSQVSAGARAYAGQKRSAMVEGLQRRLGEHPLESVAIGAGIAYPLVRIAAKIPAPILLLGAGVALAGRGGSASPERVEVVVEPSTDAGAARPVGEPRVSSAAGDAVSGTGTITADSDRASAARRAARARDRTVAAGRAGGESLSAAIRRNPVAAGGASLLLGAALAALLPRSRAEGRVFGEASEDVRERAREIASTGARAGRRALEAATDEAERQDLTPEAARRAAGDAAERVRKAARDAGDEARATTKGSAKGGDEADSGSD